MLPTTRPSIPVASATLGDVAQLIVVEIGPDLGEQRRRTQPRGRRARAGGKRPSQQILDRRTRLQAAQSGRVGRRDVHDDVVGEGRDRGDAQLIVGGGVGRVAVLADIRAGDPRRARNFAAGGETLRKDCKTLAVEAEPVDDGLVFVQPEQPLPGIAGLWRGRRRARLDEAETQSEHRVDHFGMLVEAGGKADRIGEGEPPDLRRQDRIVRLGVRAQEPALQRRDREPVRLLRIDEMQRGTREAVEQIVHATPRRAWRCRHAPSTSRPGRA